MKCSQDSVLRVLGAEAIECLRVGLEMFYPTPGLDFSCRTFCNFFPSCQNGLTLQIAECGLFLVIATLWTNNWLYVGRSCWHLLFCPSWPRTTSRGDLWTLFVLSWTRWVTTPKYVLINCCRMERWFPPSLKTSSNRRRPCSHCLTVSWRSLARLIDKSCRSFSSTTFIPSLRAGSCERCRPWSYLGRHVLFSGLFVFPSKAHFELDCGRVSRSLSFGVVWWAYICLGHGNPEQRGGRRDRGAPFLHGCTAWSLCGADDSLPWYDTNLGSWSSFSMDF